MNYKKIDRVLLSIGKKATTIQGFQENVYHSEFCELIDFRTESYYEYNRIVLYYYEKDLLLKLRKTCFFYIRNNGNNTLKDVGLGFQELVAKDKKTGLEIVIKSTNIKLDTSIEDNVFYNKVNGFMSVKTGDQI